MALYDRYGRAHTDMRISVTDQCNFRCQYCMPEEGMVWLPKEEILTFEEIGRVVRLTGELGFDSYHLTGGEPLLRKELDRLIRLLLDIQPEMDLALTTNGVLLPKLAGSLYDAGLRRINISLDTLKPHKFLEITRRDMFRQALEGIQAASEAGFHPIKINAVAINGFNDDEIEDFGRWARETGYVVRFIEYMPLDAHHEWEMKKVLPARKIVEGLSRVGELEIAREHPSDPATKYRYKDGKGEVGVIPTVTEPFCSTCNRIRLTADGMVRTCLFSTVEHDIKALLRGGADDEAVKEWLAEVVLTKTPGHLIGQREFVQPTRGMSAIGG
ncbi:MAG: GTP 3',8-cyclase MoaA [Nitrospinota bacterium]